MRTGLDRHRHGPNVSSGTQVSSSPINLILKTTMHSNSVESAYTLRLEPNQRWQRFRSNRHVFMWNNTTRQKKMHISLARECFLFPLLLISTLLDYFYPFECTMSIEHSWHTNYIEISGVSHRQCVTLHPQTNNFMFHARCKSVRKFDLYIFWAAKLHCKIQRYRF